MNQPNKTRQLIFHIAIIGAFSLLAMSLAFYHGVPSGNDFIQHFQFANAIHHSIVTGEIYPSWADSQNQGYGDAAIRFYPPLSYYLLSIFRLILNDWFFASLLAFLLIFWIGGIGVYLWSKEEFSANQSLLAAGLYVLAPYHLNQIYNNFLYAEFAASAIVPFCFLFVTRVCRRGSLADVLWLSVSFALLLLTHLPLSIIGSLSFFIYAVSLSKKKTFFLTFLKLSVSVSFGVLAASFYWIRMITEMDWIKHSSPEYFSRTFSYAENFLFAPQNIRNFETDSSVLWFADLMLLAMLLISIPSAVLLFKNRHTLSRFSISVALIFFVSVLMTTALSRAIWDNLFFLQKAQFPWRWLGIVAMSGAVFAAFGIMRLAAIMSENKNRLLTIGLGATLAFYAFMSAFVVKQAVYLSKGQFDGQLQNIESAQGFDCWQTIWAKVGAFKIKEKLVAENRETRILKWDSTEKEFEVSAGDAVTIRTATFFYPHWRAAVNGENVAIEKDDDGAILIPLPAKFSNVNLYFAEPAFVRFANYLSIFCWIIFLYAFVFLLIKSRSTSD